MKTAIITDWLDKYGGAERVLTAICEIVEFDFRYAYVNQMSRESQALTFGKPDLQVIESNWLKKFTSFRMFMPLFPKVVNDFNKQTKSNYVDLVISSSWVMSKGYRIGNEIHLCYLQARNFKYVWEESDQYFKGPIKLLSFLKKPLQRFDIRTANNPDVLISNSIFVQQWVLEKYKRKSVVIYPPVDVDDFFISEVKDDYYITIGRLEPYKRFDLIVDAFNLNGKKLIIVGSGSMLNKLKRKAKANIQFAGYQTKDIIRQYLSKASAFVYAGVEDFGISIVEALASGTPVICYSGGAAREIISDGDNGYLYHSQTAKDLNERISDFEHMAPRLSSYQIKAGSMRFSKQRFQFEFRNALVEALKHEKKDKSEKLFKNIPSNLIK